MTHVHQTTKNPLGGPAGFVEQEIEMFLDSVKIESAAPSRKVNRSLAVSVQPSSAQWLKEQLAHGMQERFCITRVSINPEKAEAMLKLNTANRPLRTGRVTLLAKAMTEGRWKLTPEAISFHTGGGLLNGQHRLAAVVQSGVTIIATVWFGCEPEEFMALDRHGTRGVSDDLALLGYDRWSQRASIAQIMTRLANATTRDIDSSSVLQNAVDSASETMDRALLVGDRARKVLSGTAASVAYLHIIKTTRFAARLDEFWEALCTGANLPPKSAILKLRDWLRDNIAARNGRDRSVKEAAAVVVAWNFWARGKTAPSFSWASVSKLPEVL